MTRGHDDPRCASILPAIGSGRSSLLKGLAIAHYSFSHSKSNALNCLGQGLPTTFSKHMQPRPHCPLYAHTLSNLSPSQDAACTCLLHLEVIQAHVGTKRTRDESLRLCEYARISH